MTEDIEAPENYALEQASLTAFDPPSGPWEYELPAIENEPEQAAMLDALFAEKIPKFAVNFASQVAQNNMRNGPPDEATLEAAMMSGTVELERRHGEKAQEIIAKARAVFDRLDQRSPELCDFLCNSGCASDPGFIETLARLDRST